jgi:hypothetical protein
MGLLVPESERVRKSRCGSHGLATIDWHQISSNSTAPVGSMWLNSSLKLENELLNIPRSVYHCHWRIFGLHTQFKQLEQFPEPTGWEQDFHYMLHSH